MYDSITSRKFPIVVVYCKESQMYYSITSRKFPVTAVYCMQSQMHKRTVVTTLPFLFWSQLVDLLKLELHSRKMDMCIYNKTINYICNTFFQPQKENTVDLHYLDFEYLE